MSRHVNSRAYGIRLPNELWELIDDEAEASGMSRNEVIRRRLETSFSRARQNRKTADKNREVDIMPTLGEKPAAYETTYRVTKAG